MSNRMENKCNKRVHNSKIFNTKCLDQLYCHTNPNRLYSNKISINGNGSGSSTIPSGDLLTLFKENKQLKTMLIFHLDLIQEQSEQLIAKDKLLLTQSEELQRLNAQNNVLQNQMQDLQKQLQRQIKRIGDVSTVPPPPLAKIQCNFNNPSNRSSTGQPESSANEPNTKDANNFNNNSTSQKPPHIIGECNGKLISKIILQKISLPVKSEEYMQSPQTTTDTEYTEEDYDEIEQMHDTEYESEHALNYDNCDAKNYNNTNNNNNNNNDNSHLNNNSSDDVFNKNDKNPNLFENNNTIEEECDLDEDIGSSAIISNEDNSQLIEIKSNILQNKQKTTDNLQKEISSIAKSVTTTAATDTGTTIKHLVTPQIYKIVTNNSNTVSDSKSSLLVNNHDKENTMMDWKTSSGHIDESGSCDSTNETDKQQTIAVKNTNSTSAKSTLDNNDHKRSVGLKVFNNTMVQQQKSKRSFLLTNQLYYTREWEDEYFAVQNDCEFIKGEAKALDSDIPMLEIPKWTEHELSPLYSIEGTEDLSDETFIKRHTKLEIDEKRRKKWDVQQIREQRRIEKLKRRHCKDELTSSQDQQLINSFYPPTDAVQSICYVENLPVQAFGEMIPCLNGNHDQQNFSLPWLDKDYKNQQTCSSSSNNYRPSVVTMEFSQTENPSSLQSQQQMLNSSFVFVKKRKRHQSSAATVSCTAASNSRQRHSEKQKAMAAIQNVANINQNQNSMKNSEYIEPHCSNASQYVMNNVRN